MSRRHADIWSHPGHYLVDPYIRPWSPNGEDHIWSRKLGEHGTPFVLGISTCIFLSEKYNIMTSYVIIDAGNDVWRHMVSQSHNGLMTLPLN